MRLHVLHRVFLKVDVSRARDDRFRGPETSRNSKRPEVAVSRARNTCLWEAIITNIQNFVQPEAEPHKSLAMAWQMPRQDVFVALFGPPGPVQPSGQNLHRLLSRSQNLENFVLFSNGCFWLRPGAHPVKFPALPLACPN